MATVTVNTLEFVSALRALIPVSKQATLYSGEKERNAATIAARITPAKKLALITGNSALGAVASVRSNLSLTPSCWKQTMNTRLSTSGFPRSGIL